MHGVCWRLGRCAISVLARRCGIKHTFFAVLPLLHYTPLLLSPKIVTASSYVGFSLPLFKKTI